MNTPKNHRFTKAKCKLASGILIQARRDLRRFRDSRKAAELGLYLDAYSWVIADNYRWPFSFLNVCKLLNLGPDEIRRDLLHEASLGTCRYLSRRFATALLQFHISFRQSLVRERSRGGAETGKLVHGLL